jgi:hypothetical protein
MLFAPCPFHFPNLQLISAQRQPIAVSRAANTGQKRIVDQFLFLED